ENLKVAQSSFKTTERFQDQNWSNYTKHNYAVFNVYHTWTEYVNRLLGALSGLVLLLTFIFSITHLKSKPRLTLLCFIGLIGIILQGVLGKIVVDTLLSPYLISLHMILALLLVAWYIFILKKISQNSWQTSRLFSRLSLIIIGLFIVQIMLGVQVRQSVDFTVKSLGYENKHLWNDAPGILFYIHRSFSVLVLIAFYFYIKKGFSLNYSKTYLYAVAFMLIVNILTGMGMYYLDFPFGFQSIHLVISALLMGLLFYIWLSVHPKIRSVIST
ncbi:MAG: COX15/CtaA family protein, partial [Flavobacteriaceae bacterium]|nr:COX15/CtaA family protein [Flavobacteriaceae bacterium]